MPIAKETGGGEIQLPPAGAHIARCCQVIDLGTQHDEYMGKPKIMRKVRIAWELPLEKAVFSDERGEEPFMCSAEYTLSLSERANLRHMLESWRGKEFTAKELEGFDLDVLVGKPCMVNIVHKTSKSKRQYAQVTSVTPLPKGTTCPKATLETAVYDVEDGPNEVFKKLPDWIREKIMASDEAKGGTGEDDPGSAAAAAEQPDEDDVPF